MDLGSISKNGFEVEIVRCDDLRSAQVLALSLYLAFTLKHPLA